MKVTITAILISLMASLGLTWTPTPKHQEPSPVSAMSCSGVEGAGEFCDK